MSGWTVVDANTNKSQPITGKNDSGAVSPYFTPAPGAQDPVGKLRVSTPQALIDTDFEYGQQPTKWESVALQNNRQSLYYIPATALPVTNITGTTQLTITFASNQTIAANTPIYIQNSTDPNANGWGVTYAGVSASTTVLVNMATVATAGEKYNPTATYVYIGYYYTGCGMPLASTRAFTFVGSTVTVTTSKPHGLSAGSLIMIKGTTGPSTATQINGPQVVVTVATANTFTFTNMNGTPSTTIVNVADNVTLFGRPAGYTESRPFDGGVAFSAGSAVPNAQLIRQTRRYFRYQSGKGIQFSTGTSLCPPLFVTSIVNASGTVTVTTRYAHNMTAGTTISVQGCDQGYFNGTYVIATVTTNTLTYTISTSNTVTATGFSQRVIPLNWYGSSNRVGFFDQQNGLFFEYDGQTLYAVWRNSVGQLSGTCAVTVNTSTVTGTGTQFTTQLLPNDFIVIRGQSYRVLTILSDTDLRIAPEYRGTTLSGGAVISKTVDVRVPRSQWADPLDGTGPSGYNLDITRMQMWYIDYSWYGAGFARWGLRTSKGQITYIYQQTNNNQRFEAYMRSGNMAAHYESNGLTTYTSLAASLSASTTTTTAAITNIDTTIPVTQTSVFNVGGGVVKIGSERIQYGGLSATSGAGNLLNCVRGFTGSAVAAASGSTVTPDSISVASTANFNPASSATPILTTTGTLKVVGSGDTADIEYITYTGKTGAYFWGLTRAATGGAAAAKAFTYSATAPVLVEYAAPDTVASLSHWGSSVIMDGQFNDDKSLVFNYGMPVAMTTTSTSPVPILAIRLAPSVDTGTVGLLGGKEIINRMQLQLSELQLFTTGTTGYLVNLILNGVITGTFSNNSGNFQSPTSAQSPTTSSLAQVNFNVTNTVTIAQGESVAGAYTPVSGPFSLDLSGVRDLGNSILGGGTSNTIPTTQANFYPDGPDILYVVAIPLSATSATIQARISWKEAQA